tara:strand:- start:18796 stop:19149 length:354 start_codon:yes stop_codon:yes gene_type:complete
MKFREFLKEAAGKNIKVGSNITWKNDDGDTLTGVIAKMTKDMSGTKVFKIKARIGKGKEILTTWPVGEIMRKATIQEYEKYEDYDEEDECECDETKDEDCEKCSDKEDSDDDDSEED